MSTISPTRTTSYAETWKPKRLDRLGRWLNLHQMRRVLGETQGRRCADIGCGYDAAFARQLLGDAKSILLVDIRLGDAARQVANGRFVEGYLPGVLDQIDDHSVDLIYSSNVLEHLRDDAGTVRAFHRLLAPKGRCVINVPSWRGKALLELVTFRLGLGPPPAEIDDHKRYYDPQDLWPILVEAGFLPSHIKCRRYKLGVNTIAICTKPDVE
jgi:SAM-dependent methyltransferase